MENSRLRQKTKNKVLVVSLIVLIIVGSLFLCGNSSNKNSDDKNDVSIDTNKEVSQTVEENKSKEDVKTNTEDSKDNSEESFIAENTPKSNMQTEQPENSAPVEKEPELGNSVPAEKEPELENSVPAEKEPELENSAPVEKEPELETTEPVGKQPEPKYGSVSLEDENVAGEWYWNHAIVTYTWNEVHNKWFSSTKGSFGVDEEQFYRHAETVFPKPDREGVFDGEEVSKEVWVYLGQP